MSDTQDPHCTNACTSAERFYTQFFINFQPVKLLEYRGNVIIFSYSFNGSGCCIDYGLNTPLATLGKLTKATLP